MDAAHYLLELTRLTRDATAGTVVDSHGNDWQVHPGPVLIHSSDELTAIVKSDGKKVSFTVLP